MQEGRKVRLQSLIQEEISRIIPREIKDPRVKALTITQVDMSPDGSHVTVYFTLFGRLEEEGDDVRECTAGLTSAAPFIRRHLAKTLTVKHIPALTFKQDKGFLNALKIEELLRKVKQ